MGRRKKKRNHVGLPGDAVALTPLLAKYVEHLAIINYSKTTIANHENCLQFFLAWCEERGIVRATDVTRPMILQYQRTIFYQRSRTGAPLGFSAQHNRMTSVMSFFRWLTREGHVPYNPATEIDLPKVPTRLPKHVLSAEEADRIMNQPDLTDVLGVRNRAILELFYSAGIRRSELMNLKVFDLDLDRGSIVIREGKGHKDRIVPIGERAVVWVSKYIAEVRPWLARVPDLGYVFLAYHGDQVSQSFLSAMVHNYIEQAGIGKKGSCHLFRHACATLMLENGADIRFIQTMLGHRTLEATEIYTHVSIRKLKEIHTATHPSARMARREDVDGEEALSLVAASRSSEETKSEE